MRNHRMLQSVVAAGMVVAAGPLMAQRTITADVVALDQAFYNNRLGAFQAGGMIFALRGDVVSNNGSDQLTAGNVMLRGDKRPRPMVLRMDVGDCIKINFQNLLAPVPSAGLLSPLIPFDPTHSRTTADASAAVNPDAQPGTRLAGVHATGLELKELGGDGSWVGSNPTSLAAPGDTKLYQACA